MKLNYNILWFEDNNVSYNGKKEMVRNIIEEELGFVLPEPRREINAQNIATIDYRDLDLIIVDLNLANDDKGTDIVDFIRNSEQVFTEVMFYSSSGEDAVREALKNFKIDGAYCADRRDEDFEDKVRQVIITTIKKVQDLNNMRGLIMAETSDIDKTMLSIIQTVLGKSLIGVSERLIAVIYENVSHKVNEKKEKFERYNGKRIDKIVTDPVMFDTSEKIKAVQFIVDSVDHATINNYKNDVFRISYSDITKKRNLLGHETHQPQDGRIIVGTGDSAFEFNDEFCIEIRKKVKKHAEDLDTLFELINTL